MAKGFKTVSFLKIIFLIALCVVTFEITGSFAADYSVQRWRVVEIELSSSQSYSDPFYDVDLEATFTGPGGLKITRPAFWDGDLTWKIRFAPTETGVWAMTTNATDVSNSGLHNVTKTVECSSYAGDLDIYKHGFLKISNNGRFLTFADGTPFFYLGDTHWILPHERFETANAPGVASQFKYTVDKRVKQGFTVYQSEPIWNGNQDGDDAANLGNGFTSADLGGFANLDRKFKYIANQGLVHANAQVDWATSPTYIPAYTEDYMAQIARYWVARYGAYPVIWTIAQEIDNNMYDAFTTETIKKWFAVGQSIFDNDDYDHPVLPHMEDASQTTWSNSWWSDKPYHDGWAIQWQSNMAKVTIPKGFWNTLPTKPLILYESFYDQFQTNSRGALGSAYKSFQYGMYGYGYGASGVWNDIYSKPGEPADYGTGYLMPEKYFWWFDGANLETGDQLTHFKNFYTNLEWWKLIPRFDDRNWGSFYYSKHSLLSSDHKNTFVVFFFSDSKSTGTLKNIESGATYAARWFNPRDGQYTLIDTITQNSAEWSIPERPTKEDWVLLVRKTDLTGIDKSASKDIPYKFELAQNSPNPFNPETIIRYQLRKSSKARLEIYNIVGKLIKVLVNDHQNAGYYTVRWNGRDDFNNSVAGGVYIYILKTKNFIQSRKLVLVR